MAAEDYLDLFLLAQKNEQAPYYVVSFDVVNCSSLTDDGLNQMHKNIDVIMKYVYSKLLESEKELNKQVVVKEERWIRAWDDIPMPDPIPVYEDSVGSVKIPRLVEYYASFTRDPWIIGDCFQFTVLRDTVSKDKIVEWVYECKKMLNMKEEFHIADGYYETNEWKERWNKLYRGDCLAILEQFHKPDIKRRIKREEKKQTRIK